MRIPVEWLREFVDLGVPVEELAERLGSVGLPVESVEGAGDGAVLEIELTANRPDCMSLLGVAREVSVLLGRPLHPPDPDRSRDAAGRRLGIRAAPAARAASAKRRASPPAAGAGASVVVEDHAGCPRFTASVIEGVRVGPSPAWMQRRLEASGIRAINTVVDVTNYVMLELGQPMHAFDYDRVEGHRLIIRRAGRGEGLRTLDGIPRVLDGEMLVVADPRRAVGLAGIMGGSDTEIGPRTTAVLLEAAYWDPPTIARTARRLGVRTEASARFERGADPDGPPRAQARAARLLAEVCGGRVRGGLIDVYPRPLAPRVVRLRPERATAVLGIDVPRREMVRILRALGCRVEGTRTLRVRVPTFRPDLTREEDLIEEVIRIYGYDRVPLTLPRGEASGRLEPALEIDRRMRDALVRCGLTEVLTLTLVSPAAAGAGGVPPVVLQNPLASDQAALRTSLLPGLLDVLSTNASRRVEDVQIFELGRVFHDRGRGRRAEERRHLGIAIMGRWRVGWNAPAGQAVADVFHLKGSFAAFLAGVGISGWEVAPVENPASWWHPALIAQLGVRGQVVAQFGELHSGHAAAHHLPHRAYMAEVDLEALRPSLVLVGTYAGLPRHPAVERDLALVLPTDLPAARVVDVIREAAGPLLEAVELFDVYTGSPVPPEHRSLAYRLRLRAVDRTLTADEAEEIMDRVRIALRDRLGAQLRV